MPMRNQTKKKSEISRRWNVLLICMIIHGSVYGMARMSGLLFVASMERYMVDRRKASFPYLLCDALQTAIGPFAGYLATKVEPRFVIATGCFMASVGIATCFFAENIETVTILWGIIFGSGFGLSSLLLPVIIFQYFPKQKTSAVGISKLGSTASLFLLPILFQFLIEKFGLSGVFLIFGAIFLNCVPISLLLKKPDYRPESENSLNIQNREENTSITSHKDGREVSALTVNSREIGQNVFKDFEITEEIFSINDVIAKYDRERYLALRTKAENYLNIKSLVDEQGSTINRNSSTSLNNFEIERSMSDECSTKIFSLYPDGRNSNEDAAHTINSNLRRVKNENYSIFEYKQTQSESMNCECATSNTKYTENHKVSSYLALFSNPTFLLVSFVNAIFCFEYIVGIMVIVDFSRDMEIGMSNEKYIMTIVSVLSCTGLVAFGWVTDRGYLTSGKFAALSFLVVAIMIAALPWSTGFTIFGILLGVWSFFQSVTVCLIPVVLSDYLPENLHTMAISSFYFLATPMYLSAAPLIGYFRDDIGCYNGFFYLRSLLYLLCSISMATVPYVSKCHKNDLNVNNNASQN